jgi:hypothetical protein
VHVERRSVGGRRLPFGTGNAVGFSAWPSGVQERQVAGDLVSPGPFPPELGSVLFKWAGRL